MGKSFGILYGQLAFFVFPKPTVERITGYACSMEYFPPLNQPSIPTPDSQRKIQPSVSRINLLGALAPIVVMRVIVLGAIC